MFISVTRLRLRAFAYLPFFLWRTFQSSRQVVRAHGFLGGRTLVNSKNVYWTITAWESEEAMREFRSADAHRSAMPKLLNFCDEASVVHWNQDDPELPTWEESHRRMKTGGRLSKVNHPSPDQLANRWPPPQPSRLEQALEPRSP
jgi:hypothetical protein